MSSGKKTAILGGVTPGEGRIKIIVPVMAETFSEATEQTMSIVEFGGQIVGSARNDVDIIKWRMDFFSPSTDVLSALGILTDSAGLPILVTLRTADEGRKATETFAYQDLPLVVARSGEVSVTDVEAFRGEPMVREVTGGIHGTNVAVMVSYHDLHAMPTSEEIISRLGATDTAGADVLRLTCMSNSVDDLPVLLSATHRALRIPNRPLIMVAVRPIGTLPYIVGGVFSPCTTFAAIGEDSAPGQIPVSDLRPALDLLDPAQLATS